MKLEKNHERCIGAGQCVLTEPRIFDQDERGLVRVLNERPQGADRDAARKAVYICPAKALSLTEE